MSKISPIEKICHDAESFRELIVEGIPVRKDVLIGDTGQNAHFIETVGTQD